MTDPELIVAPQTELAVSTPAELIPKSLPDYMRGGGEDGTELMGQYLKPPRLAIVQLMTKREIKEQVGPEGTIFARPANITVAAPGEQIRFIPVFFYPEFIKWNPRGSKRLIVRRTFDQQDEIALRARSFDKKRIYEPCPEFPGSTDPKQMVSNQEHLNFIIVPLQGELLGQPIMLTFSKTGLKDGYNLINEIKIRKAKMWGLIFTLMSGPTQNDRNEEWEKYIVRSSTLENGIVEYAPPDWFEYCGRTREEFKAKYEAGLLEASYEAEEQGEGEEVTTQASTPENRF